MDKNIYVRLDRSQNLGHCGLPTVTKEHTFETWASGAVQFSSWLTVVDFFWESRDLENDNKKVYYNIAPDILIAF